MTTVGFKLKTWSTVPECVQHDATSLGCGTPPFLDHSAEIYIHFSNCSQSTTLTWLMFCINHAFRESKRNYVLVSLIKSLTHFALILDLVSTVNKLGSFILFCQAVPQITV